MTEEQRRAVEFYRNFYKGTHGLWLDEIEIVPQNSGTLIVRVLTWRKDYRFQELAISKDGKVGTIYDSWDK